MFMHLVIHQSPTFFTLIGKKTRGVITRAAKVNRQIAQGTAIMKIAKDTSDEVR